MMRCDPRLAEPVLLRVAARRATARKAPQADPAVVVPPGWWRDFLWVCCRELPGYGVDILLRLGFAAEEIQHLVSGPEDAFAAWVASSVEGAARTESADTRIASGGGP
jgi:hypothetical protein